MQLVDPNEDPQVKHDRITELLERRSSPLICITCGEEITDPKTAIKSAPGSYHGPPKDCEEGKRELEWWQK